MWDELVNGRKKEVVHYYVGLVKDFVPKKITQIYSLSCSPPYEKDGHNGDHDIQDIYEMPDIIDMCSIV